METGKYINYDMRTFTRTVYGAKFVIQQPLLYRETCKKIIYGTPMIYMNVTLKLVFYSLKKKKKIEDMSVGLYST